MAKPTICLCMMVRNERHVIERALLSAKPWVDMWCINDTGSTDATQDMVWRSMGDLPGRLVEAPWVDFGHNRTLAFADARASGADFVLVLDADQTLEVLDGAAFDALPLDGYNLTFKHAMITYPRPILLRAALPWHWIGVTHEYATCDQPSMTGTLGGVFVHEHADSSRRTDGRKNREDILLLESALREEPENERTVFYLAQSYRDAKNFDGALTLYRTRIAMGGFIEERFCSAFGIARIYMYMQDWDKAVLAFHDAYALDPTRAEAPFHLASGYLDRQSFALARLWFEEAACLPKRPDRLFLEDAVYDYLAQVGYILACHGEGDHESADRAEEVVLAQESTPPAVRAALLKMHQTRQIMPLAYFSK